MYVIVWDRRMYVQKVDQVRGSWEAGKCLVGKMVDM